MFGKKPAEQGCGKWLSTKTTRRLAQSIKNTSGKKKGRKRPALLTNIANHVTIDASTSSLSLSEIGSLSRGKQSKMEQFFKPVQSSIQKNDPEFTDDAQSNDDESCNSSKRLTLIRQHQKLSISSEDLDEREFPFFEDYSYPRSQQFTGKNSCHDNRKEFVELDLKRSAQDSSDNGKSNQETKLDRNMNKSSLSNEIEPIRSPKAKRIRSFNDSPRVGCELLVTTNHFIEYSNDTNIHNEQEPTSPYDKLFNRLDSLCDKNSYEYSDVASESFHYSQWVKEQANKSKELQNYFPINDINRKNNRSVYNQQSMDNEDKPKDSVFNDDKQRDNLIYTTYNHQNCNQNPVCNDNTKIDISPENPSQDNVAAGDIGHSSIQESDLNTESQFHITEWANEQKEKCKFVQENTIFNPKESTIECKNEQGNLDQLSHDNTVHDNFRFTKQEQVCKFKCSELQKSNNVEEAINCRKESKGTSEEPLSDSQIMSVPETQFCIPESQDFDNENYSNPFECANSGKHCNNKSRKVQNMQCTTKSHLADISNIYPNNKLFNADDRNTDIAKNYKSTDSNSFQDSVPFQYTEWVQKQRKVSKEIQNQPDKFKLPVLEDDEFWEKPLKTSKTTKNDNRTTVLASDTDQGSDTDESIFSL